jgi:hypothetical protein
MSKKELYERETSKRGCRKKKILRVRVRVKVRVRVRVRVREPINEFVPIFHMSLELLA